MIYLCKKLPSRERQKEYIKKFSRLYEISVRWAGKNRLLGIGAYNNGPDSPRPTVWIDSGESDLLSIFFHELGHHYCATHGLWKAYHTPSRISKTGKFYEKSHILRVKIRTGFKAERWVDRWAELTMAMHFPNLTYIPGYSDPGAKPWFHKYYLSKFKFILHARESKRNRKLGL